MTPDDRERLARLLALFGEVFREPVSELKAEGYYLALQDISIDALERASHRALEICKFFPRPAELRELVIGKLSETAELAWVELLREIRSAGYTGRPDLPDATWEAIKAIWGGWVTLCQTLPGDGPELLGWQKRFVATYSAMDAKQATTRLLGAAEDWKQLTSGSN